MRKTFSLSLAALGVASIATAAVVTTRTPETEMRRTEVRAASTTTHEMNASESEPKHDGTTKRDCKKRCTWFD